MNRKKNRKKQEKDKHAKSAQEQKKGACDDGASYARSEGCGASSEEGDGGGCGVRSGLSVGAASERSFGAMSGGVAHVGVHAEDSGLLSEASFGALSCGGASFGRSEGGGGSEGEGEGDVECERSFGALSGGVRSERSGALSEVSFGGGGSVAGVSYARSEGCGASSEEGDCDGLAFKFKIALCIKSVPIFDVPFPLSIAVIGPERNFSHRDSSISLNIASHRLKQAPIFKISRPLSIAVPGPVSAAPQAHPSSRKRG